MKKVKIEIKDAYGIGFLNHEFDFDYNTGNGHATAAINCPTSRNVITNSFRL